MNSANSSVNLQGIRSLLNRIPTLAEMSSYQVVLTLWRKLLDEEAVNKKQEKLIEPFNDMYGKKLRKSLEQLAAPSKIIKDLLDHYLPHIAEKVDCWMEYSRSNMLPEMPVFVLCTYLNYLVWDSNGEIDYKKTARKLLLECDFDKLKLPKRTDAFSFNLEMGPFEQFAFLCKFCLEDIIDKIDVDEYAACSYEPIDMETNPVMYYWICKSKNKLNKIRVKKAVGSLEKLMLSKEGVDNWTIIEHFWSRLNERDQVLAAVDLLKKYESWRFAKPLLASMNDAQICDVVLKIPCEIVKILWLELFEYEVVFFIWSRTKHLLTGDQFSTLMQTVLEFEYYMNEGYVATLMKVWDTADEHLKTHFLTNKRDVIKNCYFSTSHYATRSLQFLSVMLSHPLIDAKYRKDLMLEHGQHLVVTYLYTDVEKIIEQCLPLADDVTKFKKKVIESPDMEKHCIRLSNLKNEPEYFSKFVRFYAPDEATMSAYLKRIAELNKVGK